MLISKNSGNNIQEKIRKIENKFDIVLSDDYRSFLKKYNGGQTPDTRYSSRKVRTDIRYFYGFVDDKRYDIEDVLTYELPEKLLKNKQLVIATNVYGDYFTIGVSEENKGEIRFVYHDSRRNVVIAENFKDFIAKCKSEPVGYIPSIEERRKRMIEKGLGNEIDDSLIKGWQAEIDKYSNIHQEEVIMD